MSLPNRQVLLGMTLGAVCATALSAIGPGLVMSVFADEASRPIDLDALVRIDETQYRITHEDWVSTEPLANTRIKKIGYGQTSYVDIAETATGTYSTDSLASPHVLYPGIHVEEVKDRQIAALVRGGGGLGWLVTPLIEGSSFLHLRIGGGQRIISDGSTTCILARDYSIC